MNRANLSAYLRSTNLIPYALAEEIAGQFEEKVAKKYRTNTILMGI